jgi:DNA-binding NarL/FixJ family response regulator
MSALHVLLISNRPAVQAFLDVHSAGSVPPLSITAIQLSAEALEQHAHEIHAADVAMIDVGADPDAAVIVCQELHQRRPDLRVLAVVCCPNPTLPWHVRSMLANGVQEMLDAQSTPDEVVDRLLAMVEDRHSLRVALHRDFGALANWSIEQLGRADQALLELVAGGQSDLEIGLRLQLGERTVRQHVRGLRQALQLKNREELAAWAGANGFYRPRRLSPSVQL